MNGESITVDDAKTQIKVLYSQIDDIKSQFYQDSENCDKEQITEIKLALVTTLALLDNVDFSKNRALVTSSLRHQLVQLTYCRKALMSNI